MREVLPSGTPVEVVRTEGAALGVVIAPDIWGLRALFDDLVATLVHEHGWSVMCVEPFAERCRHWLLYGWHVRPEGCWYRSSCEGSGVLRNDPRTDHVDRQRPR